jgi:hypothetical protein
LYTKHVYRNDTIIKLVEKINVDINSKQQSHNNRIDKKIELGNKFLVKKNNSLEMESYKIIERF